jgi:hypothetical protein
MKKSFSDTDVENKVIEKRTKLAEECVAILENGMHALRDCSKQSQENLDCKHVCI